MEPSGRSDGSGDLAGDLGERDGLFELWPALLPDEIRSSTTRLDVVAIHGLGGHPRETWTDNGKLWLRDFVPQTLKSARILSLGYNSTVAFSGSASNLDDFATSLLERLLQKRRQFKDANARLFRPIIFVCHSLGGIVFKRALVMTHLHSARYGSLGAATRGVMFIGTPHRGADIASWSTLFGRIVNTALPKTIRTDLLDDLKPKSQLLMTVASDFVECGSPLKIFSIYEQKFTPPLRCLIVDKDSAILHLPNEVFVPIAADHISMCKFSNATSEAYGTVNDCLRELIEHAKGKEDARRRQAIEDQFMASVAQFDHRHILQQTPSPLKGTCHWLTAEPEFQRWSTTPMASRENPNPCRVLYIYGFPGVGKTVMTKYLLSYLQQNLRQPLWSRSTVVYFFCDDKDLQRRTSLSLLRSILHQILTMNNQLLHEDAMEAHMRAFNDHSMKSEETQELWDFFFAVVRSSQDEQLWVVIDALDELDDFSRKDVIQHVKAARQDYLRPLKILFTDRQRPRPDLTGLAVIQLGKNESREDVRIFIRQKISELCEDVPIDDKYRTHIETEICLMAHGMMLHASLAFANFTRGVTDWTPRVVKSRLNELKQLPASLESYYAGLLRRIPVDFRYKARRAFIWVLGSTSRRALTVKELQYAVSITTDHGAWSELQDDLGFNFDASFQHSCGYLLKVNDDGFVVFAHQTVKELLEKTTPAAREVDEKVLVFYRISPHDVDEEIITKCTTLLSFRNFGKYHVAHSLMSHKDLYCKGSGRPRREVLGVTKKFPLLAYAIRFWHHLQHPPSEIQMSKKLQLFMQTFQANYFRLAGAYWGENLGQHLYRPCWGLLPYLPPLHHCIQIGDFPTTVSLLIDNGENINQKDAHHMTPLLWACVKGCEKTVRILLAAPNLNIDKGLPNDPISGGSKPIHIALEWVVYGTGDRSCRENIISSILADPRLDPNAIGPDGETPLHISLRDGQRYRSVSENLLERDDVDLEAVDVHGMTPLIKAFQRPEHQGLVIKMLDKPGLNLDEQLSGDWPHRYSTCLERASEFQWEEVEKRLTQWGLEHCKPGVSDLELL